MAGAVQGSELVEHQEASARRLAPAETSRAYAGRMSQLANVAAALADRTRARMLEELLGGPPLPAGALAVRVGVAPSTVSGHLGGSRRRGW